MVTGCSTVGGEEITLVKVGWFQVGVFPLPQKFWARVLPAMLGKVSVTLSRALIGAVSAGE